MFSNERSALFLLKPQLHEKHIDPKRRSYFSGCDGGFREGIPIDCADFYELTAQYCSEII